MIWGKICRWSCITEYLTCTLRMKKSWAAFIYFSFLRTNYANTDTRNANIWLFFTADGTSGVGTSGSNSPCHNSANQQAGTFAYSSVFTDSSFAGVNINEYTY